jgi:hypothetical protein
MKKQIAPSTKAFLLRSALALLTLLAICAIPFALAQSHNRANAKPNVSASAVQPVQFATAGPWEITYGKGTGNHEPTSPALFVFTVTNTNDVGPGSLRQAIFDSNVNPAPPGTRNLITFNIPGPGVQTIMPASPLPDIVEPVLIDGYTQPGSSPNTNPPDMGNNA